MGWEARTLTYERKEKVSEGGRWIGVRVTGKTKRGGRLKRANQKRLGRYEEYSKLRRQTGGLMECGRVWIGKGNGYG